METAPPIRPKRRPRRLRAKPSPSLYIGEILVWADAFYNEHGRWPIASDGRIPETWNETWRSVDRALRRGCRSLLPGSSLARLLHEHRGVRNRKELPPYTIEGILAWADAHRARTGEWPHERSGPVLDAAGETWNAVESALRQAARGLPGGSSIARVLAEHRNARNKASLSRLTIVNILSWADAYRQRTGTWPKRDDGAIPESPGDDWRAIDACLLQGNRGLKGGRSLAKLLAERRGIRNRAAIKPLTQRRILSWADAHFKLVGKWPTLHSGPILEAAGDTWAAIDSALHNGGRGLSEGSSLALLLHQHRGVRHKRRLPRLSVRRIVAWARAHRRRTGRLPTMNSGPVIDSPGETWTAVNIALRRGRRGLPGGSSLSKLLQKLGGVRQYPRRPLLNNHQIITWALAHRDRTGKLPTRDSGPIVDSPGDTWMAVHVALRMGLRGLPGGSSLSKLLKGERRKERLRRARMRRSKGPRVVSVRPAG
jgi:hypothetical protein